MRGIYAALIEAIPNNAASNVRRFLESGANPNARDEEEMSVATVAASPPLWLVETAACRVLRPHV